MSSEVGSFKFQKVFNFNSPIYALRVANKTAIAVTKNILLRFTIGDASSVEDIKIPCDNDLAQNIFLDPMGNHALICMQTGQTFYLHKSSKKCRLIKEAKGLLIESVGWNIKHVSESSTGYILLGTVTGDLIETKFNNSPTNFDQYWKVIHKLDQAITGIVFDSYPDTNNSKYFLIFTTATNLYHIFMDLSLVTKGNSLFTAEFEKINQNIVGLKCITFPMQFGYSCLDLYYPKKGNFPSFVAWMNGAGIYYSKLHQKWTEAENILFNGPKLLHYANEISGSLPISLAATEFHAIVQYYDVVYFTCVINEETLYSFTIDKLGKEKGVGLCKDSSNGFIYLFTNSNLYRINCDDETNNLWTMFLNLNNYKLAYEFSHNDTEKNVIRIKEAEELYKEHKFSDSAVLYGNTDLLFEETVLLFIDLDNKEPLKKYLLTLNTKPKANNTQSLRNTYDVINMWLLELFFEDIINHNFKSGLDITNVSLKILDPDYKRFVENTDIIHSLKRNKSIIYEKIKIYGDCMQSAIFAEIIQDREKIMENLIEKCNFQEALKLLSTEKSPSVHYRYGAKVIEHLPEEVVDLWIKLSQKLDPKKVLPIIRTIPDSIAKKYVKYVLLNLNCDYEEMHNFYVLICARLECSSSHGNDSSRDLIEYLEGQGTSIHDTRYDPTLALRICMEYRHIEGSVFLHCLLNKHKEAVEFALKEKNVELSKKVASNFYGPEEVKRHLWLQIAHFIIKEEGNVHEACHLVKSQHILKLEDILPYFPDFVQIEQFSEAICDSLDYYESHMNNLRADMNLSTDYANKNRYEINLLKQRALVIPENASCAYCKDLLTTRPFCVFSCEHRFHLYCLEQVVEPMLSIENRIKLYSLKERLAQTTFDDIELKRDWQGLISEDCCYCGTIAIDNVDVPLLSTAEFDSEMTLWG